MVDEAIVYSDCWPMVAKLVDRFRKTNRELDRDELRGEAVLFMLEAMRSYKEDMGMKISSWIHRVVWQRLTWKATSMMWRRRVAINPTYSTLKKRRSDCKKSCFNFAIGQSEDYIGDGRERVTRLVTAPEPFDLKELMEELSEEARHAILLAIHCDMKKTELSKTLLSEFGWERSLLRQVFQEIKECL